MIKTTSCALFAFLLPLSDTVYAGDNARLKACLEMQGKVPSGKALECYNRIAQEQLPNIPAEKSSEPPAATHRHSLADEWTPSDEFLRIYKQNYFLFYTQTYNPNDAPTSPNPNNRVTASWPLDDEDMKFQISLKTRMLEAQGHTLWFGYTQLTFWQFYDSRHVNPAFRESDYEPELIYSYRPEGMTLGGGMTASFLNAGLVHQSNGQALPRSRAWNRYYIQIGLESDFGDHGKLALLPRLWQRMGSRTADDNNPDITHYLGYGDIEARYYFSREVLIAIARIHSLQFDLSIPVSQMFDSQIRNTDVHLQFFDGYGESLIDYNQSHRTYGIGLSLPLDS